LGFLIGLRPVAAILGDSVGIRWRCWPRLASDYPKRALFWASSFKGVLVFLDHSGSRLALARRTSGNRTKRSAGHHPARALAILIVPFTGLLPDC
jgi:hypothetical protein